MRRITLANVLLTAGVALGAVVAIGIALDVGPHLSPPLLKVAIYKLGFIGAVGLIAAGAFVRRVARRQRVER